MKLLLWVEPLVEMGRPIWKRAWVTEFAAGMIEALEACPSSPPDEIVIAAGASVLDGLDPVGGARSVPFEERELREGFEGQSNLQITCGWYLGHFDQRQLETTASAVRRRLGSFEPEVIVTHSPAPYLARAYPEALVLHREYGPFSRKPFTKTWYLDPCGMYRQGFAQRFATQILARPQPTAAETQALETFRSGCLDLLERRNPFRVWLARQRDRFEHLVLLPLQFFGYYAIDANCPWHNGWEQLDAVLARIPHRVGVVVTTHPEYNLLDGETVACLRRRHPHFLFDEHFEDTYACSQFLLPGVDALLTVSSALGWQALVWQIPLVALGPCYQSLAQGGLEDLERILTERAPRSELWPRWLLGEYAIPSAYLHDGRWLRAFFERSLARARRGGIDDGFFDPIAPLEQVLAHHLAELDETVPHPGSSPSRDRLIERWTRAAARRAAPPSARVAIEHAVEETLAVSLARARAGRWEEASDQLAECRAHLGRMLEWIEANENLVAQAQQASSAATAGDALLDRAEALEAPAAAAQIIEKVLTLPALGGVQRARGECLLARLALDEGRAAAALDHYLRALAADPFLVVDGSILDALLRARELVAAGRQAIARLGLPGEYCLHLALAPPSPDQRWPGWPEVGAALAVPLLYAGPPDTAPISGGQRCLGMPGGPEIAALLERAALVLVDDPAAAVVCHRAGAGALFLAREGWQQGFEDSLAVECLTGPWGRLRELEPAEVLARIGERRPGLVES